MISNNILTNNTNIINLLHFSGFSRKKNKPIIILNKDTIILEYNMNIFSNYYNTINCIIDINDKKIINRFFYKVIINYYK